MNRRSVFDCWNLPLNPMNRAVIHENPHLRKCVVCLAYSPAFFRFVLTTFFFFFFFFLWWGIFPFYIRFESLQPFFIELKFSDIFPAVHFSSIIFCTSFLPSYFKIESNPVV